MLLNLILTKLILNIFCFENSLDPDLLAIKKLADQDLHCFPLCKYMLINGNWQINWIKFGSVVH